MKKTSPNQRSHSGEADNQELSGRELLEDDQSELYMSEQRPLSRHLPAEMNQKDSGGSRSTQTGTADTSMLWHELISPLTLIKGYTSTMLQLSESITDGQREQYLRGIDSASNRMVGLLEELRDVSRLEESGYLHNQRVSLRDLLRGVVSEVQNQAVKHVIVFHPNAPLPRVSVDPERIARVINNLLSNAIKYSPDGGDIEVEVRLYRTDREFERLLGNIAPPKMKFPSLVISVADNGIGVPDSDLDRIFGKFYRVNSKLTRTVPGVGLGLYICKMIVEAHNGQIWARNRASGGSVFSFSLPLG